jgi:O-antigen/teichoic acid export membrane protein
VPAAARPSGFLSGLAPVTAGVLAAGAFSFAFLSIAGRVLGPVDFAPVSSLWAMVFIVGPGVFLPLQQELARVLGSQRARGGGGAAVRRALVVAATLVVVLAIATLAVGPWLVSSFLDGRWSMLWCFLGAVVAYAFAFTARGVLSGAGAYTQLGQMVALESFTRLLLAGGFALVGLRSPTAFGAAIALGPALSTALVWWGSRSRLRLTPGHTVAWRELTRAFGWLVLAALLMQLLANAGPLAVQVLEPPAQDGRAGLYLGALMIARIGLYLFQAVQATLLPNLAELAATGRLDDLRWALRRIVVVSVVLVVVSFLGGLALGPLGVRLLFGGDFRIGAMTMAVLASASAVYMLAAALNGAALSVGAHRLSALAWLAGCVVLVLAFELPGDLFTRVDTAYALGACTSAGVLLLRMPAALRGYEPVLATPTSGPV